MADAPELRSEWLPVVDDDGQVRLVRMWTGLADLAASGVFNVPLPPAAQAWVDSLPDASLSLEGYWATDEDFPD